MIFVHGLDNKLMFFIDKIESEILQKFIIGFYQISDRASKHRADLDINLIDSKKLKNKILNFLNSITFIEEEVKKSTPTEEMAVFLTYMGDMFASLIQIEKSILFYRESIKIRENYLGVKHLSTAENYQSIGAVYEQGGAFDEALSYYRKSLEIRKELSYVENNLLVAESYSRLALVYYHLEHYSMALGYIEQTVRIREKLLVPNHTLLENSYYNHKLIEKACQPKKDYLKLLFGPILHGVGAFIHHLVGQK